MQIFSKEFRGILEESKIYSPDQVHEVLDHVRKYFRFSWANKKVRYFNVPAALDIETSSFYQNGEKVSVMYEWTIGIFGAVIIGRTWDQLVNCLWDLSRRLDLDLDKRLLIFVHNLSYEFQFIRTHFIWSKVFAIDNRKPVYAVTDDGIEFRCSYMLSGYSLQKLGDQLLKYPVSKLVGGLDYSKIRHSGTPLTDTEIEYCVNDVKVVMAYAQEYIEKVGGISRIPLTKTGVVRKYCRECCFYDPGEDKKKSRKRQRYKEMIGGLVLDPEEYKQLKRAFQGGFTHANPYYTGKIVQNVTSFDFTSSYPCVMVADKYPISKSELINIESEEELTKNLQLYCCLFDVEFTGLRPRIYYENYISESRCFHLKEAVTANGRIVSAAELRTTITEQDFFIIRKFYMWDHMRVSNFRRYRRGYLPTDFVKAVLSLYSDKTTLKGVEGKEAEYLASKEMLNSCYGMAVTDIVRPEFIYDKGWLDPAPPDHVGAIEKYNKDPGRFLYYPWGVWVTAHARKRLFSGIMEFGPDYIYSDTDSIKVRNAELHTDYIEEYNKRVIADLKRALDFHGIPQESIFPETRKGVKKPLGVWDFDGEYTHFKTLGAKRYMVEYSRDPRNGSSSGEISLTVSGLNKRICVPYMLEKYGSGIFDAFCDNLYIPPEYTGKNTHTYIDDMREGIIYDYLGQAAEYRELSSVHLEAAEYSLSISRVYADYIRDLDYKEI